MKNIIFTLFTFANCFSSAAQSSCDCKKFRTGLFEIASPNGNVAQISRTETEQIEVTDHSKTISKVAWVDSCTFKLIPVSIKDKNKKIGSDIVQFTFIETLEHAYVVHISIEGKDFEINAKVYEKGYLGYDEK